MNDISDHWDGYFQRGPKSKDYDIEDGPQRRKGKEFVERKKVVDARLAVFKQAREKYRKKDAE